jgi:hypothetical protein
MAKISFGNQSGKSRFNLDVTTHGDSATEISAGDQTDLSERDVHITDLPAGTDFKRLAIELAQMRARVAQNPKSHDPAASENLHQAEKAAKAGDGATVKSFLKKAGSWALDLAKTVGAEVAESAIKASLGIG